MTDAKAKIIRFPSTRHLIIPSRGDAKGDQVFSSEERADFLNCKLIIEEKLCGGNIGISLDSNGEILLQSRKRQLEFPSTQAKWNVLKDWADSKRAKLEAMLGDEYILHGELLYSRDQIYYDELPDWVVGIDLREKHSERFLSVEARNEEFEKASIVPPPHVATGYFTEMQIVNMEFRSRYADQLAEGMILRYDNGGYCQERAKFIIPEFTKSNTRKKHPVNRLATDAVRRTWDLLDMPGKGTVG